MNACSKVPTEILLATSDTDLYDTATKSWKWTGELYVHIMCLPDKQRSVTDRLAPSVDPSRYIQIQQNPTYWNFCLSDDCTRFSESIQLIFTFDPTSTNPNDYLQYVIDIYGDVTDKPDHSIVDKTGAQVYFDIVQLSKIFNRPYLEIWLTDVHEKPAANVISPDEYILFGQNGLKEWPLHLAVLVSMIVLIVLMSGVVAIMSR